MPLFGRSKPTLQVTVEPAQALPGQPVQIRVDLGGEVDDKVRSVQAGLTCINRYAYESTDSDGDKTTSHATESLHQQAVPLGEGGRPQSGQHDVTLPVPADASPSAPGTVDWQAWGKVDRPGRDVNESMPLVVLAPASLRAVDAQADPVSGDDCDVRFDGLTSRSVRPGDRIEGTLSVTPREDVKATDVRVELRAIKTSTSSRGTMTERLQDVTAKLAGGGELAAGQTQSWRFALEVPTDAPPSLQTALTTVQWRLIGVVARRMRGDHRGHVIVQVHHG